MPECQSAPPSARNVKGWEATGARDHFVQFYRTDDYLIECLAGYVAKAMWAGERALVIATPEHRVALEARLRVKNVDVASNTVSGKFVALDAQEMLSRFIVGGKPDPEAFRKVVGEAVRLLTEDGTQLRAFGEMVAILWAADNREGAIELEKLWNELARDYAFTLFCAYPADCVSSKDGRPGMEHICSSHSCVIPFTTG
jgi:hypothetical protein